MADLQLIRREAAEALKLLSDAKQPGASINVMRKKIDAAQDCYVRIWEEVRDIEGDNAH